MSSPKVYADSDAPGGIDLYYAVKSHNSNGDSGFSNTLYLHRTLYTTRTESIVEYSTATNLVTDPSGIDGFYSGQNPYWYVTLSPNSSYDFYHTSTEVGYYLDHSFVWNLTSQPNPYLLTTGTPGDFCIYGPVGFYGPIHAVIVPHGTPLVTGTFATYNIAYSSSTTKINANVGDLLSTSTGAWGNPGNVTGNQGTKSPPTNTAFQRITTKTYFDHIS